MRRSLTVEHIMTTAVITLRATDSVGRARKEMTVASIRHLPVVDAHHRLLGIVSDRDLLRVLGTTRQRQTLAHIMTSDVVTVRPWTTAEAALNLLLEHKISALPVVGEDEQLVGVVTETDFLGLLRETLHGDEPSAARP
jgi:CBS domain-containing protein